MLFQGGAIMITTENVIKFAKSIGAQDCGIANVERFSNAPEGFKPTDVFKDSKSVVVCIKKMPSGIIENPVSYTKAAEKMYDDMDKISMELCRYFDNNDIKAIFIPANTPYLYWDQENMHGRGILSLKHAAVLAGLGIMGRNTIFINKYLGNMVNIGAVLIDYDMEPTPLITDFNCPTDCRKCLDTCPMKALDGITVNQKLCRERSITKAGRNWDLYSCSECRKVCTLMKGIKI